MAQAEARVTAAISSEAVARENLRRIQDQRVQDWTNSGTPIPAIGETQVLLGTPVIGWGELIGTSQAPPEGTERTAAAAEGAAHSAGTAHSTGGALCPGRRLATRVDRP